MNSLYTSDEPRSFDLFGSSCRLVILFPPMYPTSKTYQDNTSNHFLIDNIKVKVYVSIIFKIRNICITQQLTHCVNKSVVSDFHYHVEPLQSRY
jgi:hypothetical protein